MGRGRARHYCRTLSRGVAASPRRHQPPAAAADGAGVTRCYKRLRPLVAKCTKISANSVYHTGPAHGRRPLPGHLLGVPILFVLEKFFMKSLFVRSGLALLCAMVLASCGGSGGGSMLLSGAIVGLTKSGLVLVNGSGTDTPLGGVVNGLKSTGLLLSNGSDVVSPTPSASSPGASMPFTFPVKVADGAAFGVTVLSQPLTGTCSVASPSVGTMPAGNYTNLVVNCQ